MTRLGAVLLAIGTAASGAAGWACNLGGCGICAGGFQLSLLVDQLEPNPITLEIEVENGRSTWTCTPALPRCAMKSELEGARDFDVTMTMVVAGGPFQGMPCDAAVCIDLEIKGESDDAADPGTYGPKSVAVSIIGENGAEFSQDYDPEYDRSPNYGGEECGYCDSRESFDERATID